MDILLLKKIDQLATIVNNYDPSQFGNHVTHNYGNTVDSVCMGNDPRLSDSRNPLPHEHPLQDLPSNLVVDSLLINAGSGLTGGGSLATDLTLSHSDTSSQPSVITTASNQFIKSVQLDTFGHIVGLESGTVIDLNNFVTDISGGGNSNITLARQGLTSLTLSLSHTHTWGNVTGTPTTISGYGIADAYNKTQIDQMFLEIPAGIRIQDPVKAATIANITLSGIQTIDGIGLSQGNRVLVKNQTNATTNGVYIVQSSTWTRATDLDQSSEIAHGFFYFVEGGSLNGSTGWMLSLPEGGDLPVIGTTAIPFKQFFSSEEYHAGTGLIKTGNTFSVDYSVLPTKAHEHSTDHLISGTLPVVRGGTGSTTFTPGNVLVGNGTGALTTLSRSGIDSRSTYPPASHWHNTSDITVGTFSVARGGTGLSSLTTDSVLVGNGTNNVSLLSRSGIDTRTSFPPSAHNHNASNINAGTLAEERLPLDSDRLRKITISTLGPSGGSNGDVWFRVY